jgi:hypothetical protein
MGKHESKTDEKVQNVNLQKEAQKLAEKIAQKKQRKLKRQASEDLLKKHRLKGRGTPPLMPAASVPGRP